jgi:hypothetical protein
MDKCFCLRKGFSLASCFEFSVRKPLNQEQQPR